MSTLPALTRTLAPVALAALMALVMLATLPPRVATPWCGDEAPLYGTDC